jgi:hypothetical protein
MDVADFMWVMGWWGLTWLFAGVLAIFFKRLVDDSAER